MLISIFSFFVVSLITVLIFRSNAEYPLEVIENEQNLNNVFITENKFETKEQNNKTLVKDDVSKESSSQNIEKDSKPITIEKKPEIKKSKENKPSEIN